MSIAFKPFSSSATADILSVGALQRQAFWRVGTMVSNEASPAILSNRDDSTRCGMPWTVHQVRADWISTTRPSSAFTAISRLQPRFTARSQATAAAAATDGTPAMRGFQVYEYSERGAMRCDRQSGECEGLGSSEFYGSKMGRRDGCLGGKWSVAMQRYACTSNGSREW